MSHWNKARLFGGLCVHWYRMLQRRQEVGDALSRQRIPPCPMRMEWRVPQMRDNTGRLGEAQQLQRVPQVLPNLVRMRRDERLFYFTCTEQAMRFQAFFAAKNRRTVLVPVDE